VSREDCLREALEGICAAPRQNASGAATNSEFLPVLRNTSTCADCFGPVLVLIHLLEAIPRTRGQFTFHPYLIQNHRLEYPVSLNE